MRLVGLAIVQVAEALRRLYFAGLALKSSLARGRKLKTAA
jgi:hypothetical protein